MSADSLVDILPRGWKSTRRWLLWPDVRCRGLRGGGLLCEMLTVGCEMLTAGYEMLTASCEMLMAGCEMKTAGC